MDNLVSSTSPLPARNYFSQIHQYTAPSTNLRNPQCELWEEITLCLPKMDDLSRVLQQLFKLKHEHCLEAGWACSSRGERNKTEEDRAVFKS